MLNTQADIRTEGDFAPSLPGEYTENKSVPLKTSAFMGLALATITMEISGLAALALGFIFVGSKLGEVSEIILQTLMEKYERGDKSLDEKWAKFMVLGLGLLYLGEVSICNNSVRLLTTLQDFRMLLM
jgi:26S proteasome regulatory subunit N1